MSEAKGNFTLTQTKNLNFLNMSVKIPMINEQHLQELYIEVLTIIIQVLKELELFYAMTCLETSSLMTSKFFVH